MERIKDLKGRKFKDITESDYGGIQIEFEDGLIAYFDIYIFPDNTVSDIVLDRFEFKKEN